MSDLKRGNNAPTEETVFIEGFNLQDWNRSIHNWKFTLKKVRRQEFFSQIT